MSRQLSVNKSRMEDVRLRKLGDEAHIIIMM